VGTIEVGTELGCGVGWRLGVAVVGSGVGWPVGSSVCVLFAGCGRNSIS
jgi:hypothetical protein